jgi:membrane protein
VGFVGNKALRLRFARLRALAERSARNFSRHDMVVYAMALAYRGLFALFPFAILLVALLAFLRAEVVLGWLAEQGPPELRFRPPEPVEWLVERVRDPERGWVLASGIVVALWSVSMGARLLMRALNAVLEVEETRPLWKRVAFSVVFAPGLAFAGIAAAGLMLVTSRATAWLAYYVGLDAVFVLLWGLLRVPVALLLLALVVSAVYLYAPDADLAFRSVAPGAILAVTLWGLASLAFSFLLSISPDFGATYGGLGAAISLLLYLYVSAFAVLLGAEVNAAMLEAITRGDGAEAERRDPYRG